MGQIERQKPQNLASSVKSEQSRPKAFNDFFRFGHLSRMEIAACVCGGAKDENTKRRWKIEVDENNLELEIQLKPWDPTGQPDAKSFHVSSLKSQAVWGFQVSGCLSHTPKIFALLASPIHLSAASQSYCMRTHIHHPELWGGGGLVCVCGQCKLRGKVL